MLAATHACLMQGWKLLCTVSRVGVTVSVFANGSFRITITQTLTIQGLSRPSFTQEYRTENTSISMAVTPQRL
jgi:hypothetical protein